MTRLKIILRSNYFYLLLIFISLFEIVYFTKIKEYRSVYNGDEENFLGVIKNINIDDKYLTMDIMAKEKLKATYYFSDFEEKQNFINKFSLGDKIYLTGELEKPNNNTNPNQFNYKKYLYNKKIYYILKIDKYKLINKNNNYLYNIKNKMISRTEKFDNKSSSYIASFLFGKTNKINDDIKNNYQKLGVSHLFAVSGMHVSLLTGFLIFIFKKLKFKDQLINIIITSILLFYMFLTDFTSSILRSGMLFILMRLNKTHKFELDNFRVFIIAMCFLIIINPFIIYDIGFIFSSVISGYLILFSSFISNRKNYFTKSLTISSIAWIVSFPIVIYNFYEVNLLSVFYNLLFVPFISFIVFPFSVLTYIFDFLKPIFSFFIYILETLSMLFSKIDSTIIFKRPSLILVYGYFVIITFSLWSLKYSSAKPLFILLLVMIIHYNYNILFSSSYILMLDVKQGDSFIFHSNNHTFLIDTGGNYYSNSNIASKLISVTKSLGIRKIDYVFITHGDYDHMGEAINLVENFKVEKVIFNCGEYNDLEKDLIKVLDKNKIPYYSCIKELNIDDNKLYFLNNKDYGNENDNSSVIYTEFNNYKFLFMGDAGVEVEEDLLEKYNLQDIDVLKVGHHGSKTSSSKSFIDEINPKYSIISVGKNNRYGHPNDNVLVNLEESKIYRTDQEGSIMFKVKNNKLQIETCPP